MLSTVGFCFCVLAAVVVDAQSTYPAAGVAADVTLPVGVTMTKHHAQDELGHRQTTATLLAIRSVVYAYWNPEGKQVKVSYTADHRGFRVLSNDLPVAPSANLVPAPVQVQDTVEVAQAKSNHMAAVAAAKAKLSPSVAVPTPVALPATVSNLPVPVQDTFEVAAAKRDHAAKWNAAKAAADAANLRSLYRHGAPSVYNYGNPSAYYNNFAVAGPVAYNQQAYISPHLQPLSYNLPPYHQHHIMPAAFGNYAAPAFAAHGSAHYPMVV
uniref:Cuticular protein n=1 Tax=Daphnia galeata TaxID=27404 RepID=A0A8J2RIQ4_9CRUS|nr:unnamed protein product [Daphnia galeata]